MMSRRVFFALFGLWTLVACSAASFAVEPDEILPNPAMEARARALSQHLRCLVCQNQSIDDSNAPLARDLRILLRERLKAGDTDKAAINFIVARYGNFVLLKPPVQFDTIPLWFGPGVIFILALFAYWMLFWKRPATTVSSPASNRLSADEREELETILRKGSAS